MKKTVFNDFRYVTIASSMKGFKEVLVSFTANGKDMHQVIFLEEMKGASNATYLKAAKQEIERQIKNNELMKKSKRTINNTKKPLVIALTAAIAVGAVIGTYFLTRYYNGGDTPAPVATGYTVLLLAGEGKFENGDPFLVFENIKEGTALKDIEGYARPTTIDNRNLEYWVWGEENNQFLEDALVTQNLYLTAKYFAPAEEERKEAVVEISNKVEELKNLEGVTQTQTDAIDEVDNFANTVIKDATTSEQVNAIKDYTIETLELITEYSDPAMINIIKETFGNGVKNGLEVAKSKSPKHSAAILNLFSAHLKSYYSHASHGKLDEVKDILNAYVNDLPNDDPRLKIIYSIIPGVIENSVYIESSTILDVFKDLVNTKIEEIAKYNLSESANKELGGFLGKYFVTFSKMKVEATGVLDEFYNKILEHFSKKILEPENLASAKLYEIGSKIIDNFAILDNSGSEGGDANLAWNNIKVVFEFFDKAYSSAKDKESRDYFEQLALHASKACRIIDGSSASNFQEYVKKFFDDGYVAEHSSFLDLIIAVVKAFANLPGPKLATQLGINIKNIYDILESAYTDCAICPKETLGTLKSLYRGIIESASYSDLYANKSAFANIAGLRGYQTDITGKLTQGKNNVVLGARMVGGIYNGLSKFANKLVLAGMSHADVANIIEVENTFQLLSSVWMSFELLSDEIKQNEEIAELTASTFSNCFINLSSLMIRGDKSKFKEYCDRIFTDFGGVDPAISLKSFKNLLTCYAKYFGANYLFECGSVDDEVKRLVFLYDKEIYQYLVPNKEIRTSERFDEIMNIFDNCFYSKLTKDISEEKILELFENTKTEVAKILGK